MGASPRKVGHYRCAQVSTHLCLSSDRPGTLAFDISKIASGVVNPCRPRRSNSGEPYKNSEPTRGSCKTVFNATGGRVFAARITIACICEEESLAICCDSVLCLKEEGIVNSYGCSRAIPMIRNPQDGYTTNTDRIQDCYRKKIGF